MSKEKNKVLIDKLFIEVNYESHSSPEDLSKEIEYWVKHILLPWLEKELEDIPVDNNDIIRIEKLPLEVDVEQLSLTGIQSIKEKILSQIQQNLIQQQIDSQHQKTRENIDNPKKKPIYQFEQILIFFLINGHLPWWSHEEDKQQILKSFRDWAVQSQANHIINFIKKNLKKDKSESILRFLSFFSEETFKPFIEKIKEKINPSDYQLLVEYKDVFQFLYPQRKTGAHLLYQFIVIEYIILTNQYATTESFNLINDIILDNPIGSQSQELYTLLGLPPAPNIINKILSNKKTSLDHITNNIFISELIKKSNKKSVHTNNDKKNNNESNNKKANKEYIIDNSGLVLLHPFIPHFFKKFNLKENISDHHKKAHILQYIITGDFNHMEFSLPLNKLLSGMHPMDFIGPWNNIESQEKIESETALLLESVIGHWSKLGQPSIEHFRSSFLQRKGKLYEEEKRWILRVESEAYDILLKFIPWGYQVIQIPESKKPLHVEWYG